LCFMAVDLVSNLSEIISALPPEIAGSFGRVLLLLKAIGVFFIVYVIYLIVMAVVNFHRVKKLKGIERKLEDMEKSLNLLIEGKKSKSKKSKPKKRKSKKA